MRGGGKTMLAMHKRTYEECRRIDAEWCEWRAANRRPTGKRAQRGENHIIQPAQR